MLNTWIGGTLELGSKVRYGITTHGTPIYRFIPYDRSLGPFAVGCSQRNGNIHAIVEYGKEYPQTKELPRANLVQILGNPTPESELAVLMATYAFDGKKELRPSKTKSNPKEPESSIPIISPESSSQRVDLQGWTFHIDPPGCMDVDDSFTFLKTPTGWTISINIADVAAYVKEGDPVDLMAKAKATSFYSPTGTVLASMLPRHIEEAATLLPGQPRLCLSLQFDWSDQNPQNQPTNFRWLQTTTTTNTSYTYDEAQEDFHKGTREEIQALASLTKSQDSHKWVETMMILYNTKAGEALKAKGQGILRTHSQPQQEKLDKWIQIDPELAFLAYDSATFVEASASNPTHFGLATGAYAYASSPIRRYCDLVNQRILKGEGHNDDLVQHLNRRQKQAKSFSRDLFFMTELRDTRPVTGVVVETGPESFRVYVPVWKRVVKVRSLTAIPDPKEKSQVSLTWYLDMKTPFWKERMVFRHTIL